MSSVNNRDLHGLGADLHGSKDEPDEYKSGFAKFYGLDFMVSPDVLIPRPETEMIVDEVKEVLNRTERCTTVIDVGTGSGCIAITIAKKFPQTQVTAVDISRNALTIAKENAKLHKMESKITFVQSDLLENLAELPDIIVANLPYIPHSRLPELDKSVVDFEPVLALDGGSDGFGLYRKLLTQIARIRKRTQTLKYLFAEIDDTQGEIALKEIRKYFPDAKAEIKKDFAGLDRLLLVRFGDD